ncbi:MAG: N-formylglutamate amidohydrolase [Alphaproteobacteria bacterium]
MDIAADHADIILAPDEPSPVTVERENGASPFFLVCDHAGKTIPRSLGNLGLPDFERERHIAWDISAARVARRLSARFDATLVLQTYSRLVIDCNRQPGGDGSIATLSEITEVPGNRDLRSGAAAARARKIFHPYHDAIAAALDARAAAGRPSVLVAVHSFTPVFKDERRPWHLGILYNRDPRFARILLDMLAGDDALCIGDNRPYAVGDDTDYTIPVHGEQRGLPHVELEIRQDLIENEAGQAEWAERLDVLLSGALERLRVADPGA